MNADDTGWNFFCQVCCRLTLPSFFPGGLSRSQGGGGDETLAGKMSSEESLSNKGEDGIQIDGGAWNGKEEGSAGYEDSNHQLNQPPNEFWHQDRIDREERQKEAERKESGEKETDSLSNGDQPKPTGDGWSWI